MGTMEQARFPVAAHEPNPLTDTGAQLAALDHLAFIAEEQARESYLDQDPWAESGLPISRPSPLWEHWGPSGQRQPTGEMVALRTDWRGTAAGGPARVLDRQALDALRRSGQQAVLPPRKFRVTAPEPRAIRILLAGVITGAVLGAVLALHLYRMPNGSIALHLNTYGIAVSLLIGFKLILSMLAVPARDTPANRAMVECAHVSAIITCHNEDPAAFTRCLDTLAAQSRMPDSVTVIDDAS